VSNGCPVCCGLGRVLAFGLTGYPVCFCCPECAGLSVPPASADDHLAPSSGPDGEKESDAA
jgi:hypothetical protein